jgi:hypothetical protein
MGRTMNSFLRTVLRELAYGGLLMSPVWHTSVQEQYAIDRAVQAYARSMTDHIPAP